MQKIRPFLWFVDKAEEAVNFYITLFPNSKILSNTRIENTPGPEGNTYMITFVLAGQEFLALNGGEAEGFNNSQSLKVSFYIDCDTQEEIDILWDKLSQGGRTLQCGWVIDRYGFTWQVVPKVLGEMMEDTDPERVRRVTEAMLKMEKLEIAPLEAAYESV